MQVLKKFALVGAPQAPAMPKIPVPPKIPTPPMAPEAPKIPTSGAPGAATAPVKAVSGQQYVAPPVAGPPRAPVKPTLQLPPLPPPDPKLQAQAQARFQQRQQEYAQRKNPAGASVPPTPEYAAFAKAFQQPGQRIGDVYGSMVDPKSPEVLQYWQKHQQERASQMARNPEQAAQDAKRYDPAVLANRYIRELADKRTTDTETENAGTAYQRALGFNRLDPRTGKYTVTADSDLGKNPEGLYGALKGTLGGIPTAAAGVLTLPVQALKGDFSPMSGAMRDLMALPNHLRGTDIGHNIKQDAAMRTPYDIQGDVGAILSNKDVPTTPGIFSAVREPLTQQTKSNQLDAAAGHMDAAASDKDNGLSPMHRILARAGAAIARNADDAYLAAMTAKGLGLTGTSGGMVGGALSRAVPTALDPDAGVGPQARATNVVQNAIDGAMTPFAVNPLYAGTQEAMNQYGVQDAANSAGNYIRESFAAPDANRLQRAVANATAGTIENAPGMLPAALGAKSVGAGLKNVGLYAGLGGATEGATAAMKPTDASPEAAQQFAAEQDFAKLPVVDQNDARLKSQLGDIRDYRDAQGLPATPELNAMAEPAAATPQQDSFDFSSILPNGDKIKAFVSQNAERAQKMVDSAGASLKERAASPEGRAVLQSVEQTGELPAAADKLAKYNIMQEGFDADKIGQWYNQLGGTEKFALWGGVSMTMLGLVQALNGGGVGSWLTALLGLGTAGLTAGQSGLFGEAPQQAAETVTKPVGGMVESGMNSMKDMVGNVLKKPGVIKALTPMLSSLPDSAVTMLQKQLRQYNPPAAAELDAATNTAGFFGGLNAMSGYGKGQAMQRLTTEYGFSEDQAARWLKLWPQSV